MASTSYTTLPSSSYVGLGSQGDLFHSANYGKIMLERMFCFLIIIYIGTYDTGIGSLTANPYDYGTLFTDSQQPSSYSNDYRQSNYLNGAYSTQELPYYSTDRYAKQSSFNKDTSFHDFNSSSPQKYNNDRSTIPNNDDRNYAAINTTQPPHKTTVDNRHVESNNQHQV
jgi:hypothetical protein